MTRVRMLAALCGLALSVAWARPSRADATPDKAGAEALYELGQRLMQEHDYAEACPRLEASQALDPGVGTLLLLGDCLEKLGKAASAWATFQEAAGLAKSRGDAERARLAELRAAALRPHLSHVVFQVPPGNDIPGFELRRNGLLISRGSWGVKLPIDAGNYQLVASAPGHESWRGAIDIPAKADEPVVVNVPALEVRPAAELAPSAPAPIAVQAAPPRRPEAPVADRPEPKGEKQRLLGAVILGVGGAAMVTSGVLALLAVGKNDDSKGNCDPANPNLCNRDGVDLRNDAQNLAKFATISAVSGSAFLASGALLYLTAARDSHGRTTGLTIGVHARF